MIGATKTIRAIAVAFALGVLILPQMLFAGRVEEAAWRAFQTKYLWIVAEGHREWFLERWEQNVIRWQAVLFAGFGVCALLLLRAERLAKARRVRQQPE